MHWFWDLDFKLWDEELEKDIAEGKLEEIGLEAIAEFEANNYRVK